MRILLLLVDFITSWMFSSLTLENSLESVLGRRSDSGKAISYRDISSLFFSNLCGGECLENINTLVEHFKQRPGTVLPTADTVGRGLQELAENDIVYRSEASGISYRFNTTEKMNVLLLRITHRLGLVKPSSYVDLDF